MYINTLLKEDNAIVNESATTMEQVAVKLRFGESAMQLGDKLIEGEWKET